MDNLIIKYKPGDRVMFRPVHGHYSAWEKGYSGFIGTVLDSSDLPNVQFDYKIREYPGDDIITANQDDLRYFRGVEPQDAHLTRLKEYQDKVAGAAAMESLEDSFAMGYDATAHTASDIETLL